jgi:hypothetical protein
MSKPLPPILPFEQQPTRSIPVIVKIKNKKTMPIKVDDSIKISEQENRIQQLQQELSDLQFRYEHIQTLLSETDLLVESQQREISVLKHALTQQQQNNNERILKESNEVQKKEIQELKRQNRILIEQISGVTVVGLGLSDTVELDIDPTTALKMKQVIDSPRSAYRCVDLDRLQTTVSPQVAGLPSIPSRAQSPLRSVPGSPLGKQDSGGGSNINFAYQYHEPVPSPTQTKTNGIPILQPIPSISSLHEQLNAIGTLLQAPPEQKLSVHQIFKSNSKEFIVETVENDLKKRTQVRVREPGEGSDDDEIGSIKSDYSSVSKNVQDRTKESNVPQWLPSTMPQTPSVNSRSPSPSKSMLLKERDALEEELLTQYGRLRKLESMESILKSLTKI